MKTIKEYLDIDKNYKSKYFDNKPYDINKSYKISKSNLLGDKETCSSSEVNYDIVKVFIDDDIVSFRFYAAYEDYDMAKEAFWNWDARSLHSLSDCYNDIYKWLKPYFQDEIPSGSQMPKSLIFEHSMINIIDDDKLPEIKGKRLRYHDLAHCFFKKQYPKYFKYFSIENKNASIIRTESIAFRVADLTNIYEELKNKKETAPDK